VLAVALAGLLALGAQATVQKLGPGLHLRSGLWQVTSGLSQARFEAILSGTAVRVRFAPAGFSLERYDESAGSWRPARTVVLDGVRVRATTPHLPPAGDGLGNGLDHGGERQGKLQDHGGDHGTDQDGQDRLSSAGSSSGAAEGRARRGGPSSGSGPSPCWCAGIGRPARRAWFAHPACASGRRPRPGGPPRSDKGDVEAQQGPTSKASGAWIRAPPMEMS